MVHPNQYINDNKDGILKDVELLSKLITMNNKDILDLATEIATHGFSFNHLLELWKVVENYAKDRDFGIIVPYVPADKELKPAPYLILVLKEGSKYKEFLERLKKKGLIFIEPFREDLKLYFVGPKWLLDKYKDLKNAKVPLINVGCPERLKRLRKEKTRIAIDFYKDIINDIHRKLISGNEKEAIKIFSEKLLKAWSLDKKEQKLLNKVVELLKKGIKDLKKLDPRDHNLRAIRDIMKKSCEKMINIIEDNFMIFFGNLEVFCLIFELFAYLYDAIWHKAKKPDENVINYLKNALSTTEDILKRREKTLKDLDLFDNLRKILYYLAKELKEELSFEETVRSLAKYIKDN